MEKELNSNESAEFTICRGAKISLSEDDRAIMIVQEGQNNKTERILMYLDAGKVMVVDGVSAVQKFISEKKFVFKDEKVVETTDGHNDSSNKEEKNSKENKEKESIGDNAGLNELEDHRSIEDINDHCDGLKFPDKIEINNKISNNTGQITGNNNNKANTEEMLKLKNELDNIYQEDKDPELTYEQQVKPSNNSDRCWNNLKWLDCCGLCRDK